MSNVEIERKNQKYQMTRIHATNKGAHEKLNTNSETVTIATTKRLVILEKSQKLARKKALS